jgi:hypothetical protein
LYPSGDWRQFALAGILRQWKAVIDEISITAE